MVKSRFGGPLASSLQDLPLLGEDLYLGMQALNLSVVDLYLLDLEASLLAEYIEIERTPIPSVLFVSAITQLWLFGLYELLRTWRQRCRDALDFARAVSSRKGAARTAFIKAKRAKIEAGNPFPGSDSPRWGSYERIAKAPARSIRRIEQALDRTELAFRRLEALRVHLAKHELPKQKGTEAMAPGYGRIDSSDGSISYHLLLRDNQVDLVSRGDVSRAVKEFGSKPSDVFVPQHLRSSLKAIPESSYGVKQTTVTLKDGRVFDKVWIAWDKQVVAVLGRNDIPFRGTAITAIAHCPT